ncbi:MAG: hypothetical protein GC168_05520 [Candidatus Hydrogenedens sp.]|nr:hypothetical protein [Candidatus Hydrogenedens sp.]
MTPLRAFRIAVSVLIAAAMLQGCQTKGGSDDEMDARPPRRGQTIPFEPLGLSAPLAFASGKYPTLFDPSSRCAWLQGGGTTAEGDTMAAQARMMTEAFHVFECHITSAFEDSSIAYDAAGLRGVLVTLRAPDGTEIPPAKVMVDPDMHEAARGALREYTRTIYILFPKTPLEMRIPLEGEAYEPLRLVLDGYGTTFVFAWPGAGPAEVRRANLRDSGVIDKVEAGYRKTADESREFLHNFD